LTRAKGRVAQPLRSSLGEGGKVQQWGQLALSAAAGARESFAARAVGS